MSNLTENLGNIWAKKPYLCDIEGQKNNPPLWRVF